MATALQTLDHSLLANHPAYAHRTEEASLPLPIYDPNPRLTLALHDLWQVLRPLLCHLPRGDESILVGQPGHLSVLDTLRVIHPALVSSPGPLIHRNNSLFL